MVNRRRRQQSLDREPTVPFLLFIERAAVGDPITVEVDRPMALHPKVVGFWRDGEFTKVQKIVETRYEHGETYFRVVTDRGCFDLRRFRRPDPRTLHMRSEWELSAELDAVEMSWRESS